MENNVKLQSVNKVIKKIPKSKELSSLIINELFDIGRIFTLEYDFKNNNFLLYFKDLDLLPLKPRTIIINSVSSLRNSNRLLLNSQISKNNIIAIRIDYKPFLRLLAKLEVETLQINRY